MHKLYYFNAVLDASATYRLEATAKGNHVSAETPIVGEIQPSGTIISPAQPLNFRSCSTPTPTRPSNGPPR
ncbi:MAG: hypothetical protein IPI95_16740 [Flavobacteriales bacterium]|nr:hypothetical protein [Flavobacteriales bacterium]